jgi:DNA-binding MarR family transcriptional regulator
MSTLKLPCFCATLRQASRVVTSLYDERLQSAGIRATQFTILQALDFASTARIADLESILAMDQTTLTRNLALLARRNLVCVVDRPSGREKSWGLTKQGAELLAVATPLWESVQSEVKAKIGAQRARALHTDVFNLAAALA